MRRVPELDSLRGLAATVVLLFHLHPARFFYGWAGVDLFFVLSGYLITTIILRYSDYPGFILRFYARRNLRIWPIYYITLVGLVLWTRRLDPPPPIDALPYYLTYTQNIWLYWRNSGPRFIPALDHTWTLALEEQFYLIWPALVLWAGRRRVLKLCLATIALAVFLRGPGLFGFGPYSERVLLARCDGFALGGLLASLLAPGTGMNEASGAAPILRRPRLLFGLTTLAALAYLVGGARYYGLGWIGLPTPAWPGLTILAFGLLFFGLIGLVATSAGRPWLAPLRLPPLVYLGQISYGLYLYHYPVYWIMDGYAFPVGQPWRIAAPKLLASLAVAIASWHLIEKPILSLKDLFRYDAPPTTRNGERGTRNEELGTGNAERGSRNVAEETEHPERG